MQYDHEWQQAHLWKPGKQDHDDHPAQLRIPVSKIQITGGNQPNGIAFRDGFLYIVEVSRVLRYSWSDVLKSMVSGVPLTATSGTKIADYPTETHHD